MLFNNTGMFIYSLIQMTHSLCTIIQQIFADRTNTITNKLPYLQEYCCPAQVTTLLQLSPLVQRSRLFCPKRKVACASGFLRSSLESLQRPKLHSVRNSTSVSTYFVHRALYWFKATSSQGFMFPSKCITAALRIASGLMLGL